MWIIDMYKSHVGVLTKCNKWNIVYTKIAIRKITVFLSVTFNSVKVITFPNLIYLTVPYHFSGFASKQQYNYSLEVATDTLNLEI